MPNKVQVAGSACLHGDILTDHCSFFVLVFCSGSDQEYGHEKSQHTQSLTELSAELFSPGLASSRDASQLFSGQIIWLLHPVLRILLLSDGSSSRKQGTERCLHLWFHSPRQSRWGFITFAADCFNLSYSTFLWMDVLGWSDGRLLEVRLPLFNCWRFLMTKFVVWLQLI